MLVQKGSVANDVCTVYERFAARGCTLCGRLMYRIPSSVDPQPDPPEFREASASQTPATRNLSSVNPLETILLEATRAISTNVDAISPR